MATLYDAPPEALVDALAERLADRDEIEEPDWVQYAKTGEGRELPPEQENFWATRSASLLRKIAVDGPVGVGALKSEYGSTKRGTNRYEVSPNRKSEGSGSIIRTAVQQLEDAGLVETEGIAGRIVTDEGRSLLDETAGDVLDDLDRPELERYA
jgi:small subunit ribosomal protein S19e